MSKALKGLAVFCWFLSLNCRQVTYLSIITGEIRGMKHIRMKKRGMNGEHTISWASSHHPM